LKEARRLMREREKYIEKVEKVEKEGSFTLLFFYNYERDRR